MAHIYAPSRILLDSARIPQSRPNTDCPKYFQESQLAQPTFRKSEKWEHAHKSYWPNERKCTALQHAAPIYLLISAWWFSWVSANAERRFEFLPTVNQYIYTGRTWYCHTMQETHRQQGNGWTICWWWQLCFALLRHVDRRFKNEVYFLQ